jgi:hypothetical protein
MQLSDNTRFIALTMGAFFLVLGAATLILSMVERIFFALHWPGIIVSGAAVTIVLGAVILIVGSRRSF